MEDLTLTRAAEIIVEQLNLHGIAIAISVLDRDGHLTSDAIASLAEYAYAINALALKLVNRGHQSPKEVRKLAQKIHAHLEKTTPKIIAPCSQSKAQSHPTVCVFDIKHWKSRNEFIFRKRPNFYRDQFNTRPWRKNTIARGEGRYSKR